jgi:hypothetical protein
MASVFEADPEGQATSDNPIGHGIMSVVADGAGSGVADGVSDLQEDSDAVLLRLPPLVQGASKVIGVSALAPWLGVVIGLMTAGVNVALAFDGAPRSPLMTIGSCCIAAFYPLLTMALFSLRRATREVDGQLAILGLGSVKVSSGAAASIRRWGVGMTAPVCLIMFAALPSTFVKQAMMGIPDPNSPAHRSAVTNELYDELPPIVRCADGFPRSTIRSCRCCPCAHAVSQTDRAADVDLQQSSIFLQWLRHCLRRAARRQLVSIAKGGLLSHG